MSQLKTQGELQIFNTLSKQKEKFVPLKSGEVKMYVCGPTVYDFLHVGNFRGAIFFNLVRNWLEYKGNKVTFVYNYTDVDDKIINRAKEQGVEPKALTDRFIGEFEKDFNSLGLKKHDHNPRVTEYIDEIISLISKIIENGHGYVVDGEVFYSVESFKNYGKLSKKNIDELMVGARVEIGAKKKNPLDFSLWKPAKPGEPKWPSPWGEGRPGWHIECSAMCTHLLGDSFDIHGGGIDLIFPHHENEIAQTEAATNKPMVKYWMHNNFINMSGEKMSKSLGNITTTRTFLEKYNPEILKYFILMSTYRSPADFTQAQMGLVIKALARFYSFLSLADRIGTDPVAAEKINPAFQKTLDEASAGMASALDDDFNTPEVFARIFELIRIFNSTYKIGQKVTPQIKAQAVGLSRLMTEVGGLMSLFQEPPSQFLKLLDDMLLAQKNLKREEIDGLIQNRNQARNEKNFKRSDELRDQLKTMGIAIQDTPQGTFWEVEK